MVRDGSVSATWSTALITNDEVSAKVGAQASLGVVSTLLAGFSLTALVEIEVESSIAANCFVVSSSIVFGLSLLVMLESTLEYMFVMRELPHSTFSAWSLMEELRLPRRVAEASFVLALLCSLISTACMLHVRYGDICSGASALAITLLALLFLGLLAVLAYMQRMKIRHQARWRGIIDQRKELHKAQRLREGFFPAPSSLLRDEATADRSSPHTTVDTTTPACAAATAESACSASTASAPASAVLVAAPAAGEVPPQRVDAPLTQPALPVGTVLPSGTPVARRTQRSARRRGPASTMEVELDPEPSEAPGAAVVSPQRERTASDQRMAV